MMATGRSSITSISCFVLLYLGYPSPLFVRAHEVGEEALIQRRHVRQALGMLEERRYRGADLRRHRGGLGEMQAAVHHEAIIVAVERNVAHPNRSARPLNETIGAEVHAHPPDSTGARADDGFETR